MNLERFYMHLLTEAISDQRRFSSPSACYPRCISVAKCQSRNVRKMQAVSSETLKESNFNPWQFCDLGAAIYSSFAAKVWGFFPWYCGWNSWPYVGLASTLH